MMKRTILFLAFLKLMIGMEMDMMQHAIRGFDLDQYLGTWYEIARMDHSFERGLSHVTATYTLNENGTVRVLNRGYNAQKDKWSSATGIAKFKVAREVAALKVSFFRPFYGGYHVVMLAEDYSYALVAGDSNKYLWVLAREPQLSADILEQLLDKASKLGYRTTSLIFVDQAKDK